MNPAKAWCRAVYTFFFFSVLTPLAALAQGTTTGGNAGNPNAVNQGVGGSGYTTGAQAGGGWGGWGWFWLIVAVVVVLLLFSWGSSSRRRRTPPPAV